MDTRYLAFVKICSHRLDGDQQVWSSGAAQDTLVRLVQDQPEVPLVLVPHVAQEVKGGQCGLLQGRRRRGAAPPPLLLLGPRLQFGLKAAGLGLRVARRQLRRSRRTL